MGALLEEFLRDGVRFELEPAGGLRAIGALTDALRDRIRECKPAIRAELQQRAAPPEEAELRSLVALVTADWPADEQREALAVALADADAALQSFRALAANIAAPTAPAARMSLPTCADCLNLAGDGRCMAAVRRESFGHGCAIGPNYHPSPAWELRCAPFKPRPGYPDQRTGAQRWPWLLQESVAPKDWPSGKGRP